VCIYPADLFRTTPYKFMCPKTLFFHISTKIVTYIVFDVPYEKTFSVVTYGAILSGTRYNNKSVNKRFIVMKLPCFTMLVTNVSAFRVPQRVYREAFSRLGRYLSHEDILRRESLCESFSSLVRIDHARAKSWKNFYCRPRTILHT